MEKTGVLKVSSCGDAAPQQLHAVFYPISKSSVPMHAREGLGLVATDLAEKKAKFGSVSGSLRDL
jgi:hypothetical protein